MNLPSKETKRAVVWKMFDAIAPKYELVNRITTFGMDYRWRKESFDQLDLKQQSSVLDIACGTGDFCRISASHGHRTIGLDISLQMLKHAVGAGTAYEVVQADATCMPFRDGAFDAIVCGFALRNFVDIATVLNEFNRVLVSGGRIALLDASKPSNRIINPIHNFYLGKIVPLVAGIVTKKSAYEYLSSSLVYLPDEKEMNTLLRTAGFSDIKIKKFLFGTAVCYSATKN